MYCVLSNCIVKKNNHLYKMKRRINMLALSGMISFIHFMVI